MSEVESTTTDGMAVELAEFRALFRTADAHDGIEAFIDKRPPRFTGT